MSAESQLLARIEQELTDLSERQHAMARRITRLREVRTQLHLGCSALSASAMLAEHSRRDTARHEVVWPDVGREPLDPVDAMADPRWEERLGLR